MAFPRLGRIGLAAALAAAALLAAKTAWADRMALWHIVHEQCVPHAGGELPKPCLSVDLAAGDAVIKDRVGIAQLLAIPTARVTGIEDPVLLKPETPNYFADGLRARSEMSSFVKAPASDGVAIAINSMYSRSQDQLHLHIDCLRPDVAEALAAYAPHIDGQWRPMTVALNGRNYFVRRVDNADLSGANPFLLLADDMPKARDEMGFWSLAAVPFAFDAKPGVILLADHAELAAGGHAEDLQDHDCAIAK